MKAEYSPYYKVALAIVLAHEERDEEINEQFITKCLISWFDLEPEDWRLKQAVKQLMEYFSYAEY